MAKNKVTPPLRYCEDIEDWIRMQEYNDESMVRETDEEVVARLPLAELLKGFYKGTIYLAGPALAYSDDPPASYTPYPDPGTLWEDMMPLLCTTIANRIEGKST